MNNLRFIQDLSRGIFSSPDSEEMWETTLSAIPDEVLLQKDSRILVHSVGYGTEADMLVKRMISLNLCAKEILDKMYVLDRYHIFTNRARRKGYKNIITEDFLAWEPNMKFDVIVGNPPYQDSAAPTLKLWPKFVEKAVDLTKDNGYIAFITPRAWLERPNSQLSERLVKNIFTKFQVEQVDITAEKYFNIGEKPCSYVIHKVAKHRPIKIIFDDREEYVDYRGQKVPLNNLDHYKISIFDKIQSTTFNKVGSLAYNDTGVVDKIEDMIKKGIMNRDDQNANNVKVYWTATQDKNFYMPKANIKPGIKVIINRSGHYYQDIKPTKYIRLDLKEEYGIGAGAYGITVSSEVEGLNLISFLKSKLYRWYIDHEKTSGFNTGIAKLPLLDMTRTWSDDDIYQLFNISTEEQELINEFYSVKVKQKKKKKV